MFSHHLCIGSADESADFDFADITLGLALDPETSSVLIKPIPVGSGYTGRLMNAVEATD